MVKAMWIWTAVAAAAVATIFLAAGTVVVMVRRMAARARDAAMDSVAATKGQKAAGMRRRPGGRKRRRLGRELRTATARRLPPQVRLQMIVDHLSGMHVPQNNARSNLLAKKMEKTSHMLRELHVADVALKLEVMALEEVKLKLIKRGMTNTESKATQSTLSLKPPNPRPRRVRYVPRRRRISRSPELGYPKSAKSRESTPRLPRPGSLMFSNRNHYSGLGFSS